MILQCQHLAKRLLVLSVSYTIGTEMVNSVVKENLMQANPAKFQYILFGATRDRRLELTGGFELNALDCEKLLGVDIDKDLSFNATISRLCKKKSGK